MCLPRSVCRSADRRRCASRFDGELALGVTAKDAILGAIGQIGVAGGVGHVVEYAGPVVRELSMEGRMTVCNMSIEAGARAGMIAPDDTTFAYLEGRPGAPAARLGARARRAGARCRRTPTPSSIARSTSTPDRSTPGHLGDEPWDGRPGRRRRPRSGRLRRRRRARGRSSGRSRTWGWSPERRSPRSASTACSSGRARTRESRICALVAMIVGGRRVRPTRARDGRARLGGVRRQAEEEGLDGIFERAGFEWRLAGCSMCLGMNPDMLAPGERCASTSNRNFEGRQGRGGRTHLVSPAMAAAAAVTGRFVDVRGAGDRMKPLRARHRRVAVLDRADVDTDQIIPKQFLKRIERTGYGEFLFFDWRRTPSSSSTPEAQGPRSSSRTQLRLRLLARARRLGAAGLRFRAMLAPSFADIFAGNAAQIGLGHGRPARGAGARARCGERADGRSRVAGRSPWRGTGRFPSSTTRSGGTSC